jgi:glutathione S-transferase
MSVAAKTGRSWIMLEEKGVPYQHREINPYLEELSFLLKQSTYCQILS